MLRTDDEVRVERAGRLGRRRLAVELVEEARDEVEIGIRRDRLQALAEPRERGQRGRGEGRERARLLGVGGQPGLLTAPQAETAVRSASIGLVVPAARAALPSPHPEPAGTGSLLSGFQSPVQSSSATAAYEPAWTSSPMGYPR